MESKEDTLLEQLTEKTVRSRTTISKLLVKEFPLDEDVADFIAMEAVNKALGLEVLREYKRQTRAKRTREFLGKHVPTTLRFVGILLLVCVASYGLFWIGSGIYGWATASPYPRVYTPIPEVVRFRDYRNRDGYIFRNETLPVGVPEEYRATMWKASEKREGLSDNSQLCATQGSESSNFGNQPYCIHRNLLTKLNDTLDRAVSENVNGVVWNEPNGNGEWWIIERNNYRFVITALEDDTYKK